MGIIVVLLVMEYGFSAETSQPKIQTMPRHPRLDPVYTHTCINNLMQLELATQQWALENKKSATDTVRFSNLVPYLRDTINTFKCPINDKAYNEGKKISEPWICPNYDPNSLILSQHKYPPDLNKTTPKPINKVNKQKTSKRENSNSQTCIYHLKLLEGATMQWALENKKSATDIVKFSDLLPYLSDTIQTFQCPANGKKYNEGKKVADSWVCPNYDPQSPEFPSHKYP